MNDSLLKMTSQKELLEQRYENKKKQIKELESEFQKTKTDLEKELLILKEKNSNLQSKNTELQISLDKEINSKKEAMKAQTDNFQEEYSKLKSDYEQLRVECYEQDLQLVEAQATYEKDQALWEGERDHLKETIRKKVDQLQENQKNFDIVVNKFKQFSLDQSESVENINSVQLSRIEQKHNVSLREIKDQHKIRIHEYEDRIKKVERENRRYHEKMLELENMKSGNTAMIEERLRDMIQNERNLKEELKQIKRERDNRIERLQRKVEQDKELYRNKINVLEHQLKDVNNKLSQLRFFHEEERAKWNLDLGEMNADIEDKLHIIQLLQKKVETLGLDRERLLSDLKQMKRTSNSSSMLNNFSMARNRDFFMDGSRHFGRSSDLHGISEIKKLNMGSGNLGQSGQELRGSDKMFFGLQDSADLEGEQEDSQYTEE